MDRNPISRPAPDVPEPPYDLSFMKIKNIKRCKELEPRKFRVSVPKMADNGNVLTRSIWLNNNSIRKMEGVSLLKEKFECIKWLDLSYNEIVTIDLEILSLEHLTILYLHHNSIQYLFQVVKLQGLKELCVLTLFGNPVENIPEYRKLIVQALPKLRKLDHSSVTSEDRSLIQI